MCRHKKGFSMGILRRRNTLKLAAIFMLVGIMAGAFAVQSSTASAARAVACDPTTPLDIGVGGTCDLTVNATDSGLWFNDTATVTVANVVPGLNTFQFTTTVIDDRSTPPGWQVQALSPGLQIGGTGTALAMSIGDAGSTCNLATVGPCADFTATPTTLTGSAQTFAAEAETGPDVAGTYTLTIDGSFTLPDDAPVGAYTGTITLSILGTS
jgi:hypothetical protein